MNQGIFRAGHPRLALQLAGIYSRVEIEFIVDTGFNGEIALPPSMANELNYTSAGYREHKVAGGRIDRFEICQATIVWDGEDRMVELLIIEGEALIGTELLAELMLQIEVTEGGQVLIDPL
jgi:clan AA aspartic protease